MNICALFGGQHKNGNTATLLEKVLEGARANQHSTKRFDLAYMNIHPCKGCLACKKGKDKVCIQKDDMQQIYDELRQADVLIFATPMYWWNVTGPLKNTIDRFFALPFYAKTEQSAFQDKKLLLVMTSGQPANSDGREGLELILQKMCDFTGMTWLGTITTGTNDQPLAEQTEILAKAYNFGLNLLA